MSPSSRRPLVPVLLLALSACGGGGDDGAAAPQDPRHAAMIGLYVDEEAASFGDEFYTEIDARGRLVFWDYLGDAFDRGPDCHRRIGPADLEAVGDDGYLIDLPGEFEPVTMYRDGDALVVVYVTVYESVDGNGDVVEIDREEFEQRLPLAGLSSTDFTACTDDEVERWIETFEAPTAEGALDDPTPTKRVLGIDLTRFVAER